MAPTNTNSSRQESGSHGGEAAEAAEATEAVRQSRKVNAFQAIWENNKGALLILISDVFDSSMDAMARYLQQSQQGRAGFHTLQIITARMGITFVLSMLYMWYIQVPHFPLGDPQVRGWLVLRALFGSLGLFSLYYSVHYLPLAEATVFRFLVPLVTAWSCHVFLGQQFTRTQLTAAVIALVGIVIIAHPRALFGDVADAAAAADRALDAVAPAQRMLAIGTSLAGVAGASGAYTVIRVLGGRAHALVSVTYFAGIAAAGAALALAALPGTGGFVRPRRAAEWALLLAMGGFGFALQFLLTAGLQLDKSPRATAMLYVQVVFALGFDVGIWGVVPGGWSLLGGAVVVASTLWSALQKTEPAEEEPGKSVVDEETALLAAPRNRTEEPRDESASP